MKTLFFATAIAAALLTSCSVKEEISSPQPEGSQVTISFDKSSGDFNTRAFFDNTMLAEPHEKAIHRAIIYVCNSAGNVVMYKNFSAADLASLTTSMVMPKSVEGQECTFYAIANYSATDFVTERQLLDYTLEYVSNYNSDQFSPLNNGQRFVSGIPMSASKKIVVQPQGTPTNVSFTLKRAMAKVAIMVSVDENFSTRHHGGSIKVISARISNSSEKVTVVANSPVQAVTATTMYMQIAYPMDGNFCNLFYLGENPPVSEESKVVLRIYALFDQDGSYGTTNDQIPVWWDVKLEGSGNGEIRRNGYYRIKAVIEGIDALRDIHSLFESGEWETPVTPPTERLN